MHKLNRKNRTYWVTFIDTDGSATTVSTSTRSLRKAKQDLQRIRQQHKAAATD